MSEQKQSPLFTALSSVFPLILILSIDFFAMFLQPQSKAISHFAFGILIAQLVSVLVFMKGQICPGQRERLSKVNWYFAVFWGMWFIISFFSNYHFILTDMMSLCGIAIVLATWRQPQDNQLRQSMLIIAGLMGILGCLCYLLIFIELSISSFIQYNIFGQGLVGIILANLALVVSRNRLQGLIALLPFFMLSLLFLNALSGLGLLMYLSNTVTFANQLAWILYFCLHLLIALIIAVHIFKQWKLSYNTLAILLLIVTSLPVWASFAFIH
ncbi:hypothetical protein K7G90_000990 [Pasteurella canis]|uniref:hypothetical protein n=1 Tax=Pasteurella canis TaxID=753 RepID=UPI0006693BE1|nr:hypothetical protein [Pasteurella canis]UAY76807.1 hypothetical protein K7G90_000990 [Pasteurella canis]